MSEEQKKSDLELVVSWALEHGFATGNADTLPELLIELGAQIDRMKSKIDFLKPEK